MHPAIAKEMVAVLRTSTNTEFSDLISVLENWNGDHQGSDIAPSVYYNLLSQIIFKSMSDELGPDAFKSLAATSVLKNSYDIFIADEKSPWWDNVLTTNKKETRLEIVEQAALQTIKLLKSTSGENSAAWQWNKIHTLTHKHVLNAVKPLRDFFNVGPFPVPGGSEVINNLHFDLDTTGYYPVTGGPALRKITDFADLNGGITVSPTGQSGNVMSEYYDDQAEMFATGKFRPMWMKRKSIELNSKQRLLLKP